MGRNRKIKKIKHKLGRVFALSDTPKDNLRLVLVLYLFASAGLSTNASKCNIFRGKVYWRFPFFFFF